MKSTYLSLALLVFLGLLSGCNQDDDNNDEQDNPDGSGWPSFETQEANELEAESYAIYNLLLERCGEQTPVVQQQANPFEWDSFKVARLDTVPGYDSALHEGWQDKEGENLWLDPTKLERYPDRAIIMGKLKEGEELPKDNYWETFDAKYPNSCGIYSFSQVVFNKDQSQAVAYYSYACGYLCYTGAIAYLVKQGGQWKLRRDIIMVIS